MPTLTANKSTRISSNLTELRTLIGHSKSTDTALDLLGAAEEGVLMLHAEVSDMKNEIKVLKEKIRSLEHENAEMGSSLDDAELELSYNEEVQEGISTIKYNATNLQDIQIMEAFCEAYKKIGGNQLLTALENL